MKSNNELIEQYYRENPEAEVRHRKAQLLEFGAPTALGMGVGLTNLKGIGSPMAGAGLGAMAVGAPLALVRRAHRRKKILREMGVDESILGSLMEPIKREI